MKREYYLLAIIMFFFTNIHAQKEGDAILGTWFNSEKEAKIEIYKCAGKYCGKIVWLKVPMKNGKPKTDTNNKDDKLKTRPILGLNLLKGFSYSGENTWVDGEIYDPLKGETYSCTMTLLPDGTLKVRGYIGISLIGRTVVWSKI